jgi:hypothetical protein
VDLGKGIDLDAAEALDRPASSRNDCVIGNLYGAGGAAGSRTNTIRSDSALEARQGLGVSPAPRAAGAAGRAVPPPALYLLQLDVGLPGNGFNGVKRFRCSLVSRVRLLC